MLQRALALEAAYQFSEGINLAQVANVMSIQSENSDLNEIRSSDTRARCNAVGNKVKLAIFIEIVLGSDFNLKVETVLML